MAFGLDEQEIDSLLTSAKYRQWGKKNPQGDGLSNAQQSQVTGAITEVITQNNARILEALAETGVKIKEG